MRHKLKSYSSDNKTMNQARSPQHIEIFNNMRVLIIEDDPTLGHALVKALLQKGAQVKLCAHPNQAESDLRVQAFDVLIVDCMLPKISGPELIQNWKTENPQGLLILMSGIYNDRQFVQSTTKKTNADHFLQKPFDLGHLLHLLEEYIQKAKTPVLNSLWDMNSQELSDPTNSILLCWLQYNQHIEGLTLPLFLTLALENHLDGTLEIFGKKLFGSISMQQGQIVRLTSSNQDTYLGAILLEQGLTTAEELEQALSEQSNLRIGETLIHANFLSPHAIDIALKEQTKVRLSQFIRPVTWQIKWKSHKEDIIESAKVQLTDLFLLAPEWAMSRMDDSWLSAFFDEYKDHILAPGPNLNRKNELKLAIPMLRCPQIIDAQFTQQTLNEAITSFKNKTSQQSDRIAFLRALTVCLWLKIYKLVETVPSQNQSYKDLQQRLEKLYREFKQQDFFAILGVDKNSTSADIQKAYQNCAKAIHPDKVPPHAPESLKQLANEVFAFISEAYDVLKNPDSRQNYKKQILLADSGEIFAFESSYENAIEHLHSGRYQKAYNEFRQLMSSPAKTSRVYIGYLWSMYKSGSYPKQAAAFLRHVEEIMSQIPYEDRHNAEYFLIKSFYYEHIGDLQRASTLAKNASILNPHLFTAKIEAQRLNKLAITAEKSQGNKLSQFLNLTFSSRKKIS